MHAVRSPTTRAPPSPVELLCPCRRAPCRGDEILRPHDGFQWKTDFSETHGIFMVKEDMCLNAKKL
eukprot:5978835-Pyramimonas_sp.AAC.1